MNKPKRRLMDLATVKRGCDEIAQIVADSFPADLTDTEWQAIKKGIGAAEMLFCADPEFAFLLFESANSWIGMTDDQLRISSHEILDRVRGAVDQE